MQEIFKLSKIKELVDSENPPAIIVVDTNIILDVPDYNQWTTTLNEPLFVLSDVVLIELEHLKSKKRQVGEPTIFEDAIKGFNWLLEQGDIIGGIHIAGVGWFISIPSPAEDAINEALGKWESLVQVFNKSDIKFLILTRELSKLMPVNTVVFYTKDYNLYNIAVTNGFPACRFEDFPMAGIERWIEKKKLEPVEQTKTVLPPSATEVIIMELSSGDKTYAEMSQISGINHNTLRVAMYRLMRKGKVVKLDRGKYGLRYK